MLSTLSTLECKSIGVYVREWNIIYNVEKLHDRKPVDKDITRQGICSVERSPSVEIFDPLKGNQVAKPRFGDLLG